MAANQIHYKTLRGINKVEYEDKIGANSYIEALLKGEQKRKMFSDYEGWKIVNYKKNKNSDKREPTGTIFVAKIQTGASARDVWNFFQKGGKILDIVLPKKREKYNRIGFVKVQNLAAAHSIVNLLKGKELMGSKLDLKVMQDRNKKTFSSSDGKEAGSRLGEKENPSRIYWRNKHKESLSNERKEASPKLDIDKNNVTLEPQLEDCFSNSLIGFSIFPIEGELLTQIMKELKVINVVVKEISCWKFLFTFVSAKDKDDFD